MNPLSSIATLPSDLQIFTETPQSNNNSLNYTFGLTLMMLNKIRRELKGYTSARGFNFDDIERAINYDFRVIKRWMDYLEAYQKGASVFSGKNILELGPGADLGIGLTLIADGANSYHAMDVHNLVENTPGVFYEHLFKILEADPNLKTDISTLRHQLSQHQKGQNDRLNYISQSDFDLSAFKNKNIDLVVSNSAFQQFDNPAKTINQLSRIAASGALFIALIDLKTHTRWINKRDPLNIYRYPESIYKPLMFRGSQNRIRPFEFKQQLEAAGWENIKIFPRIRLEKSYLNSVNLSLHPKFQSEENQMELLTCVICAKKS